MRPSTSKNAKNRMVTKNNQQNNTQLETNNDVGDGGGDGGDGGGGTSGVPTASTQVNDILTVKSHDPKINVAAQKKVSNQRYRVKLRIL